MSPEKKPLTETAIDRKIDAAVAEEIAKLQRPSRAMQAVNATLDVTEKYPRTAWALGTVGFALSLMLLDGQKMWIGVVASTCLPPGWAKKIVRTVGGLRKAKGDA